MLKKNILKIEGLLIIALMVAGTAVGIGVYKKVTPLAIRSASQAELFRMSALHIINGKSRGSAVYMQDGLALSAAHVCADVRAGESVAIDYKGNEMPIESVEMDRAVDICVMKLGNIKSSFPKRDLEDKDTFLLGKTVITAGFPGGFNYSIQFATIKVLEVINVSGNPFDSKYVFLIDGYVAPGGSGSGVFNQDGKVIGIVIVSSPMMGISGIVPLEDVIEFLKGSKLGNALVK